MTPRGIAVLAFKVLGLLAVLMAIGPGSRVLPTMVVNWPPDSEGRALLLLGTSLLAPIVLPLLLGAALWFGADSLARKVVKDADVGPSPSLEAWQEFAFSMVGVFVLAT